MLRPLPEKARHSQYRVRLVALAASDTSPQTRGRLRGKASYSTVYQNVKNRNSDLEDEGGQAIYLQGGMDDALIGAVPLIPTSVPLSSRKSAEPSGLNSAFSEHLSQ